MEATSSSLAGICGARILITTIERYSANALTGCAGGAISARIFVVTGEALVERGKAAVAGGRRADRFETGTVLTWSCGTLDYRPGLDLAEELDPTLVAKERPVAKVAIFQFAAVRIFLALTLHGSPRAGAINAKITDGASVTVVANLVVVFKDATLCPVAQIGGAGIGIIALNGGAQADAIGTMVGHRAEIPVIAVLAI